MKNIGRVLFITAIVLLLALPILAGIKYLKTGTLITKNIDVAGGVSATVTGHKLLPDEESRLRALGFTVKKITGSDAFIIEKAGVQDPEKVKKEILEVLGNVTMSTRVVGPAMGESFFKSALIALAVGIALMALVVFITYGDPVTAAAFISVSIATMVEAFLLMALLNIPLSPHTIGALLMILGYSVDYQVLFASKLKTYERTLATAFTMFLTSFVAVLAIYLLSRAPAVRELALVLIFGIIFNFLNAAGITVKLLKLKGEKSGETA